MGDHVHVGLNVKIILNLNHDWVVDYMRYTLDYYCWFNWYHWTLSIGINFDISFGILIYLFMYVCFTFNGINFYWYLIFIHICFYLCSRYKFSQILFMLELEFQLYFNWFSFQLISYFKPTHSFCWYFIKGEKIRFSYFNWYLYFHSLALW